MPLGVLIYATCDVIVDKSLLGTLNSELIDQMGPDRFIGRDDLALTIVPPREYRLHADGLPDCKTMIRAHPMTPYYGPRYERGAWPELAAIVEFLRRRIPDSRVWYGEDSGDTISQTTDAWISQMWDYWAVHGGRPYHGKHTEHRKSH